MNELVKEAQTLSATALEWVRCLTEELIAVRTDRDRQENFRRLFQREALKYRDKYHLAAEALTLSRLDQITGSDQS